LPLPVFWESCFTLSGLPPLKLDVQLHPPPPELPPVDEESEVLPGLSPLPDEMPPAEKLFCIKLNKII
ncbi:MAG: hypothetical protein ACTTHU_01515, partial [Treponema sp.]